MMNKKLIGQPVEIKTVKGKIITGTIHHLTPHKIYIKPIANTTLAKLEKGKLEIQGTAAVGTATKKKGEEVFFGLALSSIGSMFLPFLGRGLLSMFGGGLGPILGGGLGSPFGGIQGGSGQGGFGTGFPF